MAFDILNWRGKFFWIALCGISLWTLIIMESIKINQETRDIDQTYFWFLLIINLLAHFLLWMSGTPYIHPDERDVADASERDTHVRTYGNWRIWERHPAVHYATGGFGKFFILLVALDIYYYGYIMRDMWYEVLRILVMDATLVVGVFIFNSHNRLTTSRIIMTVVGMTLFVYNIVMIVRTFKLLTHSTHHIHRSWIRPVDQPLIPIDDALKEPGHVEHHYGKIIGDYYNGFEHTRIYDLVIYSALLLFFSILLKLREKLLYPDRDVLGWNSRIDLRNEDPERRRLIVEEKVVPPNPIEA